MARSPRAAFSYDLSCARRARRHPDSVEIKSSAGSTASRDADVEDNRKSKSAVCG